MLVRALALGICGTDREIIAGDYGWAPPGSERLIIGHESLGRGRGGAAGCGFKRGDLVVGIVRRPDPVPCPACAADEWDMCRNGLYTERGIKQRNGYGSEHFRVEPDFLIQARSCARPSRRAAGADERGRQGLGAGRAHRRARAPIWQPRVALITGAGPVGLLAALLGKQRGFELHILDRNDRRPEAASSRATSAPPITPAISARSRPTS